MRNPPQPLVLAQYETLDEDALEIARLVYLSWSDALRTTPCLVFQGMDPDPRLLASLSRKPVSGVPGSECALFDEVIEPPDGRAPRAVDHHSQKHATRIDIEPEPLLTYPVARVVKTGAVAQVIRIGDYHWLSSDRVIVPTSIWFLEGEGREVTLAKEDGVWELVAIRFTWHGS